MKKGLISLLLQEALPTWQALVAIVASMFVSLTVHAAAITVNSVADDVFINAAGQTFSDAAYTVPVTPAYCTLRMAISSANRDAVTGGCAAGSGSDTINFSVPANSTITLAQVAMDPTPVPFVPSPPWLLFSTGNVAINGPGSALLTINGGGLGAAAIGLRTLLVSNNDGPVDAPVTIAGVSFKEGRSVGGGGGCLFSRESLTLTDVRFEGCEAVGAAPTSTVGGGAIGMGVTGASDARPNATLSNVKFIGNRAVHGAAAAASTSCCGAASFGGGTNLMGSVNIADSQFIGNVAENHGALRIANGGSATLTNTQFISNTATAGNNGAFQITAMTGTVTLSHGGAVANVAVAGRRGGGSITAIGSAVLSGDAVVISDWSFVGNAAGADIGGLDIVTDTFDVSGNCQYAQLKDVRLTNVYFERNIATTSRGGFRIACSGNVAMSGVEMTFNQAGGLSAPVGGGNSAGHLIDVAAVTMDNIRIVANKTYGGTITPPATQNGGYGVFSITGPLSMTYPLAHSFTGSRFLVKDNFVTENEAGVSVRPNGASRNYSLSDSSFVGNKARGIPGLFLNATGNYTVSNSTFSGNIATTGGGPIFLNTHSDSGTNSFVLRGITSARNGSSGNALNVGAFSPTGGTTASNATVTVSNAILGQFTFGSGVQPVFAQVLPNVAYAFSNSVVENSGGMPAGACGTNGVVCNVDAKLEGLAENGGSVQTFTHALRPGSPALDTGNNTAAPAFDQRGTGFARIINGTVDIGAFESPTLANALPCKLDMDGDNQVSATREGLVLLRSMLGFSAASAVSGTGISQLQWDTTRNNLNANCGTSFPP